MVNCSIIISLAHFSHQMLLSAPFSNCVSKCFICFPSRFHVIRISSVGACAIAVRWLCLWYSRKKVKLEKETKNNCTCSNRTQNDLNEMNDERGFVANKREKSETKTKLKLKRKEEIIKNEKRVTKTINNYFISVSDSFDGLTPDLTNVSFHFTKPIWTLRSWNRNGNTRKTIQSDVWLELWLQHEINRPSCGRVSSRRLCLFMHGIFDRVSNLMEANVCSSDGNLNARYVELLIESQRGQGMPS